MFVHRYCVRAIYLGFKVSIEAILTVLADDLETCCLSGSLVELVVKLVEVRLLSVVYGDPYCMFTTTYTHEYGQRYPGLEKKKYPLQHFATK